MKKVKKIIKGVLNFGRTAKEMKEQNDAIYRDKSKESDNLIFMQ